MHVKFYYSLEKEPFPFLPPTHFLHKNCLYCTSLVFHQYEKDIFSFIRNTDEALLGVCIINVKNIEYFPCFMCSFNGLQETTAERVNALLILSHNFIITQHINDMQF